MPLTFGNLIIGNNVAEGPVEALSSPSSVVQKESTTDLQNVRKAASTNEPVIIVNGKEKKIGKHSAYLLDMLTIDEE